MRNIALRVAAIAALAVIGGLSTGCATSESTAVDTAASPGVAPGALTQEQGNTMHLGAFSVSLTVKDLHASKAFYEKLGFTQFHGDASQNWLVMRSGSTVIGLFQGMFPKNMMTFNPGWNQSAEPIDAFLDVRDIQSRLREAGIEFAAEADASTDGPAHFMIEDPDGNPILVDQHVSRPSE